MEDERQETYFLTEEQWDALEELEQKIKAHKWPWDCEDDYAPRRKLDGEEKYWPEWAFRRV